MYFYLIISIIGFLALTGEICYRYFVIDERSFGSKTITFSIIDIGLLIFTLYLYFTANYGMFFIGMVFQCLYAFIALITINKS